MEDKAFVNSLKSQITWPLRPIITSLNDDNSWLFSFPRPTTDANAKFYYHIVQEPWLAGPTSLLSPWFVHMTLSKPARVQDAKSLEAIAYQIEGVARTVATSHDTTRPPLPTDTSEDSEAYNGIIDCIIIFLHLVDHFHEPTLRLFDKRTPIIASTEAKPLVEKLSHFNTVTLLPNFDTNTKTWDTPSLHADPLPSWLTAIKIPSNHELYFITALIWTHESTDGTPIHETIIGSPHSARLDDSTLDAFLTSTPPVTKLALMHSLNQSYTWRWQQTPGAEGGLALYRKMGGAKYWVRSHDAILSYAGVLMKVLQISHVTRTVDWALELESEKLGSAEGDGKLERPNVVEVEGGRCMVLI